MKMGFYSFNVGFPESSKVSTMWRIEMPLNVSTNKFRNYCPFNSFIEFIGPQLYKLVG